MRTSDARDQSPGDLSPGGTVGTPTVGRLFFLRNNYRPIYPELMKMPCG